MSLWLTDDELIELTGYRQRNRQKMALAELGIMFRSRPADGFPLVERWRFENDPKQEAKGRSLEPNWDAVRNFGTHKQRKG